VYSLPCQLEKKKRVKNLPLIGAGTVIGTENKKKMQFSYVFT
jgi:hypothetical protein